jgi:malate dehydrogenase (quinone)
LKQGKITDLPRSVRPNNLAPMVTVGLTQGPLLRYLIGQLLQSEGGRVQALREFAPSAVDSDWELDIAGQRVQVIRRAKGKRGVLDFGTTVLTAADGSIAGLLGASPGASTAVPAMLDVMERCLGDRYKSWLPKLQEIVPSLGTELSGEPALFEEVWSWGTKVLKLDRPASGVPAAAAIG